MDLVNAQQARRILDRLVGYSISPILWEKVRSRFICRASAVSGAAPDGAARAGDRRVCSGRVSGASRAEFRPEGRKTRLHHQAGQIDEKDPELDSEQAVVTPVVAGEGGLPLCITKVKRGERRRKPSAPFITSTLQQEASRRSGLYQRGGRWCWRSSFMKAWTSVKAAATGLITYMRTDSTNMAEVAQQEARQYIEKPMAKNFCPPTPPKYTTRKWSAHRRPTKR